MDEIMYVIDRSKMEPCDIILTSDKTVTSKGIRIATLGKFSHAAIYVGGTTIEATLKGVFSKSIQRMIFENKNQVAVFRSKSPLSDKEVKKICDYARAQTGTLYALPEAITIRARSIFRMQETRKQFCSRLVAKSYEAARYDLGNLRSTAYCTPKQLGMCKSFYQVLGVVRKATIDEIAFAKTPDPNIGHQLHTFEWLNKVRDLTNGEPSTNAVDIQSMNDVDEFLLKYPQYDQNISESVENTGYLHFYEYDTKANPYRYNEKLFQMVMVKHPDALLFVDDLLEMEAGLFPKYAQNLEGYIHYAKQENLRFFRLHIQLYISLIKQVYMRLKVIISFCVNIHQDELAQELDKLNQVVLKAINTGEEALKGLCRA
jgi:hypothetical protein